MKPHVSLAGFSVLLWAPFVHAAMPGANPCTFIGGCTPTNVVANAIPFIANLFIAVAAGAAVLFVVVGAFLMVIGFGDEGSIAKGKHAIVYALVGFGLVLLAQTIVAYLASADMFGGLFMTPEPIFEFMRIAVRAMMVIFNAVFAVVMVLAGYRMAFARGSADEFNSAKSMLIWAVVGAVVINVAHALVNAVLALPLNTVLVLPL